MTDYDDEFAITVSDGVRIKRENCPRPETPTTELQSML